MATGIQISPSSDITIGTTAISNGTEGRVLFQGAGDVVQQDAGLFWDNTNKRLGIGATPSTSVRLDVRAQGALSTDIGFRVRNSADTANILSVQGNARIGVSTVTPLAKLHISSDDFGQDLFRVTYTSGSVDMMNIRSAGFSTGTVTFAPPDGVVCNSTLKMGFNNILGSTTSYIQIENPGGGNQSMNFRTASASANLGFQFLNSSGNQIFQITNSGNVSIGATTPAARLDVRAQGALSTDIAFRVRNSADSVTLQQFNGDGSWLHRNNANTWYEFFNGTDKIEYRRSGAFEIGTNNDVTSFNFSCNSGNVLLRGGSNIINIVNGNNYHFEESTGILPTSGAGAIVMKNRTAPSTNVVDRFYMYSADIVTGNAAPHFRTEAGDVVKLYKETTAIGGPGYVDGVDDPIRKDTTINGYTLEQVVKALQNFGLLA